jgi:sensor histidine kinase YesM
MADFGEFNAKEMELRSTIVYLETAGQTQQELVDLVHQVKPHFMPNQIVSAINELVSKGLLERQASATRNFDK